MNKTERVSQIFDEQKAEYQKKAAGYGDAIRISAQFMELMLANIPDERLVFLMRQLDFLEYLGNQYRAFDKVIRPFNILGNEELDDLGEKASQSALDLVAYAGMGADSLIKLEAALDPREKCFVCDGDTSGNKRPKIDTARGDVLYICHKCNAAWLTIGHIIGEREAVEARESMRKAVCSFCGSRFATENKPYNIKGKKVDVCMVCIDGMVEIELEKKDA